MLDSISNGVFKEIRLLAVPTSEMQFYRKAFGAASSSSSCSSGSPSMHEAGSSEPFKEHGGMSAKKRLTRLRKLRHLSDGEIGYITDNRLRQSHSLPVSPDSPSPCHWSLMAVPQPLPLPDGREALIGERGTGKVMTHQTIRKGIDNIAAKPAKSSPSFHDQTVRTVNHNLWVNIPARSAPPSGFSSPFISPQRSNTVQTIWKNMDRAATASEKSTPVCHKWSSCDQNAENANCKLKLKVPARSAPASGLSSPAISPRRSNTGDFFLSLHMHPKESQLRLGQKVPTSNRLAGYSPQLLPGKMVCSPDHSSLPIPKLQSLKLEPKIPHNTALPMHHKLLPEGSMARPESESHANGHRFLLRPATLMPPKSVLSHPAMESPNTSSMKSQWQKGKLIGRGTFGSVYVATNCETGASCAMKEVDIISDDTKSAECLKQLEQEIKVFHQLKHPNIVQYYGSEVVNDHFYIYLEYVHPGSLNKYLRGHCGAVTESMVRNFTRHILRGLAYLHSTNTIHRDIKGANLLVDAQGVVKLADFGMAKHIAGKTSVLSLKGSPYWMAPEVIQASVHKDTNSDIAYAVDIWSLGCTIIEMLTGSPPWSEFSGVAAMFKVLNRSPPIPETLSIEGKDFLRRCFRRNPAERPSAVMLLNHPFVRNLHDQNVSVSVQALSGMKLAIDAKS